MKKLPTIPNTLSSSEFWSVVDRRINRTSEFPRPYEKGSPRWAAELGTRYFLRKYAIRASDILDFDAVLDRVERLSDDMPNGDADFGLLSKFERRVLSAENAARLVTEVFENGPLTYFIWNTEKRGSVVSVSPSVYRNFGYEPEHFTKRGNSFSDIIFPEDLERITEEIRTKVEVEKAAEFDLDYRISHADGSIRFVHDHTRVVYGPDGGVAYSRGYVTDVTDQKETDRKLQDYVKALDQSAIVQIVDRDGVILYVNELYNEVSGDFRNIVGKSVRSLGGKKYHPTEFWRGLWETVLAGKVWSGVIQNPYLAEHEASYYTHTTITPLQNAKGEYDRFIAIKFDVTRLKHVESALRATNARLEKILDSTSQGFWSVDDHLNIREVNSSLCQMLGYSEEELIGRNLRGFLDADNLKIFEKQALTVRHTNHRLYDLKFTRKDGKQLPVLIRATTLRDDEGEFLEAVSFVVDATDIKEYQERLYLSSITDELTQLRNRRHFDAELARHFDEVRAGKSEGFSLAMLDIDHFKRVNDGLGHDVGDEALRFLGAKLASLGDQGVRAYRLGGEEF